MEYKGPTILNAPQDEKCWFCELKNVEYIYAAQNILEIPVELVCVERYCPRCGREIRGMAEANEIWKKRLSEHGEEFGAIQGELVTQELLNTMNEALLKYYNDRREWNLQKEEL